MQIGGVGVYLRFEVVDEEGEGFGDFSEFGEDGVDVYHGLFVGFDKRVH